MRIFQRAFVAIGLFWFLAPSVNADLITFTDNPNGFKSAANQAGVSTEVVLFNDSSLQLTGTTIQGLINNTNFQLVDISSNETLEGSGGQAPQVQPQVVADDGALRMATIVPNAGNDSDHSLFSALSFNVKNANNIQGAITVEIFDGTNSLIKSFDISNGLDFFGVVATNNTTFGKVVVTSSKDIDSIQQIRVGFGSGNDDDNGGIVDPVSVVPEPNSLVVWLLLCGVVLVTLRAYRKPQVAVNST